MFVTWCIAKLPRSVTEESNLVTDVNWAREACAFIVFVHNMVRSFMASELMLVACAATLKYTVIFFILLLYG